MRWEDGGSSHGMNEVGSGTGKTSFTRKEPHHLPSIGGKGHKIYSVTFQRWVRWKGRLEPLVVIYQSGTDSVHATRPVDLTFERWSGHYNPSKLPKYIAPSSSRYPSF